MGPPNANTQYGQNGQYVNSSSQQGQPYSSYNQPYPQGQSYQANQQPYNQNGQYIPNGQYNPNGQYIPNGQGSYVPNDTYYNQQNAAYSPYNQPYSQGQTYQANSQSYNSNGQAFYNPNMQQDRDLQGKSYQNLNPTEDFPPNQPVDDKPVKPKKMRKIFDYILWLLLFASFAVMDYQIYSLDMLNIKYFLVIVGISILIPLPFLLGIIFRKKKSWKAWVSRIFKIILIAVLAFGNYTIYNGASALAKITSSESIMRVSVATSSENKLKEFTDTVVGYSISSDKDATCYAMANLEKDYTGITYQAYSDYNAVYAALKNGDIDAAIIPNARIDSLEEENTDFDDNVAYAKVYSTPRSNSSSASTKVTDASADESYVIYLSGMDEGTDPSADGRSDVNILLMINQKTSTITTISVPRDSYVPNPALGNGSDKLTHLGNDGVYNSMKGLEEYFGIDIDYYAKINFYSLIAIVDALGGIDVDVEISFTEQDENRSFASGDLITLEAGEQTLNGKQALAYARHRHTDGYGTAGRERAQQRIIKAMVAKLCSAEGLSNINALLDVAEEYVATDIPMSLIQSLIKRQTSEGTNWNINSVTLDYGTTGTYTTVSMPSQGLSCNLLSDYDRRLVYNAYLTLQGEGTDIDTLNSQLEEAAQKEEEQEATYNPYDPNAVWEDYSADILDNLQAAPDNDYVITSEDAPYLDTSSVYYGFSGVANWDDYSEVTTNLRLNLPSLNTTYIS
jgi:LCP family protein required for cell wall assembly